MNYLVIKKKVMEMTMKITMGNAKIVNIYNFNGIKNQVVAETTDGVEFWSYGSFICRKLKNGKIEFGEKYDYSRTTLKYRNIFLKMTTKEIEKGIKFGIYKIVK